MATQQEIAEQLFEAALGLNPADRAAFLDRECNGNAGLRQQVESLLAARQDARRLSEQSTQDVSSTLGDGPTTVIGPYHLLELIGEGGMGQVWLAEQKQPVRRRVAVKLIKAGMDTREVVARFQSERQALALMDHPAIAKVFDAGSTPEGRPYFVMEYVAGIPITDYCDKHRLTIRRRMELFIQVCEGVQHAHQKAIIHRDLKPSNILVTEVDGKPMPRIIDFGVAKAISHKLTAHTVYTRVGTLIGTLGYMSPEQADPVREDIDTRSDVYSLGAVLYELLTGALPLDFKKLAYDEVLRRLRDQDAPRPSTRVTTLGEESSIAAKNRGADPPTLVRQLRGDPDAIALMALEKDRARRYASASDLANDIGRYIRNEPVTAHPLSAAYRAGKYIRRHRLGVAVAAVGVLLLIAFAVFQSIQLRRIRRERDRADRIAGFMTNMFVVSNPSEARGNSVTAREILDKASNEIDVGLKNDPELQAQMMYTMGWTYTGLGLQSRAQSLFERALDIQRRALGPTNPDTLRTEIALAATLASEGHDAEAEKLFRETLEIQRRVLGPEHPNTLLTMADLASTLEGQGHYAEAEKLQREALDIHRRALGPEHPETLNSMYLLAIVLADEGHYAQAEKLLRDTIDIRRRVLGPEHPDTLVPMSDLASILSHEGRHAEAETLLRETIDSERRVLGPDHVATMVSIGSEAINLSYEGRYGDADKILRELVRKAGEAKDQRKLGVVWYDFACAAAVAGRRDEALSYLGQAIDYGVENPDYLATDPDLKSLHGDPRFDALVTKARQNTNAQPH